MIYIVLNKKGGSGKSTIASHLLPEYIRKKGIQERISLFEFDRFSQTSADFLVSSSFLKTSVISEEAIRDEIFRILFRGKEEDVILDVYTTPRKTNNIF